MSRFYMVVIGSNFSDPNRLHSFIKDNEDIRSWWHYLDTAYIIETTIELAQMESTLNKLFPNDSFLLIDINMKYYGGWLPEDAWEWFRRYKDWNFRFEER